MEPEAIGLNSVWTLKIFYNEFHIRMPWTFNFQQPTSVSWKLSFKRKCFGLQPVSAPWVQGHDVRTLSFASPCALGCNHRVITMAVVRMHLMGFSFWRLYYLERGAWKKLQSPLLEETRVEELPVRKQAKNWSCSSACPPEHSLYIQGRNSLCWWSHRTFLSAAMVPPTPDSGKERSCTHVYTCIPTVKSMETFV